MLNADHLGFHLYEFARHFVAAVSRVFGLSARHESGRVVIPYLGREVVITVRHAGVEPMGLRNLLKIDIILRVLCSSCAVVHT